MGAREYMRQLIIDLARTLGPVETTVQKLEALEMVQPERAHGGFVQVEVVVICPCGVPVSVVASPRDHSPEELEQRKRENPDDETEIVVCKAKDCPEDAEIKFATNQGHTSTQCDECGRKFLLCWELEACQVNKEVSFPWGGPEVPVHPSSELSFSGSPKKTMVH